MLDIQKFIGAPRIVATEIDDMTSKFELQYLPRWFGHTLWNALRRLVLAYNLGWAVTWIKIKGVPHEYYVIDWVKENVIDIMLNFKKLRFKFADNIESECIVAQRFTKIWKYTSSDLKLPSGVELLSDWNHLFEITDPSVELVIDVRIEKWYGYYSMDFLRSREKKADDKDVNMLLIDNDFKIVEYVKYEVEDVIEDFKWSTKDALTVEIRSWFKWYSPKEMLMFAWEILASYSKLFVFDDIYIDRSVLTSYEDVNPTSNKLSEEMNVKTMPIDALPLSERTRNALIKNNILYVEDLEKKKKWELLLMKWVWKKAIEEINSSLWNIWKALAG